jgi:hypothetical protein
VGNSLACSKAVHTDSFYGVQAMSERTSQLQDCKTCCIDRSRFLGRCHLHLSRFYTDVDRRFRSVLYNIMLCARLASPSHDLDVDCTGRLGCTNGCICVRARISERIGIIMANSGDSLRMMLPIPMNSLCTLSAQSLQLQESIFARLTRTCFLNQPYTCPVCA